MVGPSRTFISLGKDLDCTNVGGDFEELSLLKSYSLLCNAMPLGKGGLLHGHLFVPKHRNETPFAHRPDAAARGNRGITGT